MTNLTNDNLKNGINKTIPQMIDNIKKNTPDPLSPYFSPSNRKHDKFIDELKKRQKELPTSNKKLDHNHKKLLTINIISLGVIFLITCIFGILLYRENKTKNNPYFTPSRIIINNFILFIGVGICEYIFFMNIASKYIPVQTTDISNDVVNQLSVSAGESYKLHS